MLRHLMLISIEGHSVADFDTQSAFNRWWTNSKYPGFNPHYTITALMGQT